MSDGRKALAGPRVVILCREIAGREIGAVPDDIACVRVHTAYEAAAELLAEPAAAVVVELGALTRRHLRLLEIARQTGTEMLGVGAVPAGLTTADLSGIRLVAPELLAESLLRQAQPAPAPAEPAEAAKRPAEARPETPPEAPPAALTPAKRPLVEPPEPTPVGRWLGAEMDVDEFAAAATDAAPAPPPSEPAPEPPAQDAPEAEPPEEAGDGEDADAPPPQRESGDLRDLLTPDELAALLGDRP